MSLGCAKTRGTNWLEKKMHKCDICGGDSPDTKLNFAQRTMLTILISKEKYYIHARCGESAEITKYLPIKTRLAIARYRSTIRLKNGSS